MGSRVQHIDDPKIGAVEASTVKKGDWKTGILALSDGTHHLPECSSSGDILAQTLLLHRRLLLDGPTFPRTFPMPRRIKAIAP